MKLKSTKKRKLTFATDATVIISKDDSCLTEMPTMRRRAIHQRQCLPVSESEHNSKQCYNPLLMSSVMGHKAVTLTTGTAVRAHHPLPSSSSSTSANCQQPKHCSSAHLHPPHLPSPPLHSKSTSNLPSSVPPASSSHSVHQNVTCEESSVRTRSLHPQPHPQSRKWSPSGHSRRRPLQSLLMLTLLLSVQMVTVHAMLDALKALFILTGASTYLVTKYVNITNRTDGFPGDGYGYFHTNGSTLHNFNLTRLNELNPALNFFKGDLGSGASKPSSGVSSIRPMYVLAIEEEEDERSLPKVLLKLAISEPVNKGGEQRQQSSSGEQNGISAGIEYILDAKMDDLAPVLHNFQVNKSTGELFLIRPLDRDPPNGRAMWKFSVQARNRTTHYILAVADVLISVRDINDNKPLFEQKIYRTTLMENGPAGQILTKVTAIDFDDADMADNGKVVYSLLKSSVTQVGAASVYSGNPRSSSSGHHHQSSPQSISDYFQIDPHSGVLTALACCFDREKRPEYRLVARATDAGGFSDEATVVVSIGDLNDCPPKFTNPSRTLVLNDDSFSSFWLDQNSGEQFQEQPEQQGPFLPSGSGSSKDRDNLSKGGQQQQQQQSTSMDENIATFFVTDEDLPETNHLSYEIVNSTNCSLFHRFYMVANDDGSGSLLGTRAKLNSPLEYNRTYSCQLSIAVHDSVRDTPASGGQTYEDTASLTLIYRNNTPPKRTSELTSNAAVVAIDTGSTGDQQRGNSLPRPRIEKGSDSDDDRSNNNHHQHRQLQPEMAFDEHGNPHLVSDQGGLGPKAYDLTGKRAQHSECALCQNGGQCIVTETGYRFRCYCQHGFDGALCERPTHRTDIDRMLASITANELLFYGSLIVIVNLLVVVLGLMVWIVKRVRTSISSPSSSSSSGIDQQSSLPATALEASLDMSHPTGASIQMLQQPLMMSCTVMEPAEFKQALELDHYVIT